MAPVGLILETCASNSKKIKEQLTCVKSESESVGFRHQYSSIDFKYSSFALYSTIFFGFSFSIIKRSLLRGISYIPN